MSPAPSERPQPFPLPVWSRGSPHLRRFAGIVASYSTNSGGWGSAPRQQRALLRHRWIWQNTTNEPAGHLIDSSVERGSAHSVIVADISPGPSELQTPEE